MQGLFDKTRKEGGKSLFQRSQAMLNAEPYQVQDVRDSDFLHKPAPIGFYRLTR